MMMHTNNEYLIVNLPRMHVVSARATGESPEAEAWARLFAWAKPLGFMDDLNAHPVFGFNNPAPRPGQSHYGYEAWMEVQGKVDELDPLQFKSFSGGLFAVARCKLVGDKVGSVPEVWRRLFEEVKAGSGYSWRRSQELEGLVNPGAPEEEILLDLYLPVREGAAGG
ncbi:MAG: GyrI-like domain-containing protein [bacterium]|nr:GyrI-like domain-containing protein [bacterium]